MMHGVDGLIFTDCNIYGKVWQRSAGAYRLATELRQRGLNIQVIDYWSMLTLEGTDKVKALINKFAGSKTIFIGFSTTFFQTQYRKNHGLPVITDLFALEKETLLDLRSFIKTKNPNIDIILGGSRAGEFDYNFSDYKMRGYGECHMRDYLDWKIGTKPKFPYRIESGQRIVDYNAKANGFDFAHSQILWQPQDCVQQNEVLPVEVARGCIFSCKYCSYPLNGKKKMDYIKDAELLEQEFVRNYELYGVTHYGICDDTFNDSTYKMEWFNDISQRLPFKLKYSSYARVDLMQAHPEQIDLLHASGLNNVFFGIETFNPDAAKAVGKGMHPEKTTDFLYHLRERWGNDIFVNSGIILGLPHDTYVNMEPWLTKILDFGFPVHHFSIFALHIKKSNNLPGFVSEFERNHEKYGYRVPDQSDVFFPDGREAFNLWENDVWGTSFEGCDRMAVDINNYQIFSGRGTSSNWAMQSLSVYGASTLDVLKKRNKVIDENFYAWTHQNFLNYLDDILRLDVE